jgi:hypothetical protein
MGEPLSTGALFPPWTNTVIRLVLVLALIGFAAAVVIALMYVRSPLGTGEHQQVVQPTPFDHRHHVSDNGIECVYCHSSVYRGPQAGFPPTETCMGCHNQVWGRSPLLEEVRVKFFAGEPLTWNRVHILPDFVYFNHAIHLASGVVCRDCHGRVEEMPVVMKAQALTMRFCLDCHRRWRARTACTTCHR